MYRAKAPVFTRIDRVLPLSLFSLTVVALNLFPLSGALAQGSTYPKAPTSTQPAPSISFTPRPQDPQGAQSIDLSPDQLNRLIRDERFHTSLDATQQPPLQDVIGPDGTPPPGYPDLSGYGIFLNNLTATSNDAQGRIRSFQLLFTTPLDVTAIHVDTFLRTNDLQSFVLNREGQPIPTWETQTDSQVLDGQRRWHLYFNENPDYPWLDANFRIGIPAFTVLGSLFAPGSDLQFDYIIGREQVTSVPEPGALALVASAALAGWTVRRRRARRA